MSVIQRSKSTVYGLTDDLNNIKGAAGLDADLNYMSIPTANYISTATSIRQATEILDAKVKEAADGAGDATGLTTGATTIVGAINELDAELGDVSSISTTASDVAGAINEHDTEIGDLTGVNIAEGSAVDIAGMIQDLENGKLDKVQNLADIVDAAIARNNLSVDSSSEVDAKINNANLAMGTNYSEPDLVSRDALTNLDIADRVFVENDGDSKWALYKVAAIDVNGSGTSWIKIMDQDSLENSISVEAIKTSYESNADTNAFTDAEKAKVGFVSITGSRDLDQVVQQDEFITDGALVGSTDLKLASSLAVKTMIENQSALALKKASNLSDLSDAGAARTNLDTYSKSEVDSAIGTGGAVFKTESVEVIADTITLAVAPKNGVIFNFTCVRHVDANGVAYDIPTSVTGDPKVFNIHPDSAGQFDTKSVTVQYSHTS